VSSVHSYCSYFYDVRQDSLSFLETSVQQKRFGALQVQIIAKEARQVSSFFFFNSTSFGIVNLCQAALVIEITTGIAQLCFLEEVQFTSSGEASKQ